MKNKSTLTLDSFLAFASTLAVFMLGSLLMANQVQAEESVLKASHHCFNCHAANPDSLTKWEYSPPKLAGQDPQYLARALRAYRDGPRNNILMTSASELIPDDDIPGLMEDISNMKAGDLPQYPAGQSDSAALARGKALAGKHCTGCHSVSKQDAKPGMPILMGQFSSYLIYSMRDYRTGVRENKKMNDIMYKISPVQTRDLAAYYESLGGLYPAQPRK